MIKVSCPICGRAMEGQGRSEWPRFPFCSDRCRTVDLGRWLGESYTIPAEEPEDAAFEDGDTP
jgi:endogenous inhibitor of DNA gyrase (YacG/DUF329 family)